MTRPALSGQPHSAHTALLGEGTQDLNAISLHVNVNDQRQYPRQSSSASEPAAGASFNTSWSQYPPITGGVAGSTDVPHHHVSYPGTATNRSSESCPAEFYGTEEPPMGYGALNVNPAMVPHQTRSFEPALSTMPGLPGVHNASPPFPSVMNLENAINPKHANMHNPDVGHLNFYPPSSGHHAAPPSRQKTLNPTIYNMYRMNGSSTAAPAAVAPPRNPSIHVIEEAMYSGSGGIGPRKQDRFDKTSLLKTEVCKNWKLHGTCTYGNKCHFAHGAEDLKCRMRVENYKTQPCCDPAREGSRRCMYGHRCNYCHPGEAIRRPHPTPYYDEDYHAALKRDFGDEKDYPFGIYL